MKGSKMSHCACLLVTRQETWQGMITFPPQLEWADWVNTVTRVIWIWILLTLCSGDTSWGPSGSLDQSGAMRHNPNVQKSNLMRHAPSQLHPFVLFTLSYAEEEHFVSGFFLTQVISDERRHCFYKKIKMISLAFLSPKNSKGVAPCSL